ncbi:MAG: radical SAM protein [Candidatus Coatesbacteria bacterium]|nr:radical SAM protein [Candidatus Coatesbacteria bacterium]
MSERVLLIVPPTGLYLREDRCQSVIDTHAISFARPPLVLLEAAAILRQAGAECCVRDYPAARGDWDRLKADLTEIQPDILIVNVTGPTLFEDLKACELSKSLRPEIVTVAKGGYLFIHDELVLERFPALDIVYRGEVEFRISALLDGSYFETDGYTFRSNGTVERKRDADYLDDLDSLPYPARDLIDNGLYRSPDTKKPLTVIQTARGCPSNCIYCLVPRVSGKRLRSRSPDSIIGEIEDCVLKHGIREFYFNADTFTLNRDWVVDVCRGIIERGLDIRWGCNGRVDTLDEVRLEWMKRAGCHIISLGIESGDQSMLDIMQKGTTLDECRRAVALCKRFGVAAYMFFIVGLPWETAETVKKSIDFAIELDGDFAEFILARCFPGTILYENCKELGILAENDRIIEPSFRGLYLSREDAESLQRECFKRFHLRAKYIVSRLLASKNPRMAFNYALAGIGKLRAFIRKHNAN